MRQAIAMDGPRTSIIAPALRHRPSPCVSAAVAPSTATAAATARTSLLPPASHFLPLHRSAFDSRRGSGIGISRCGFKKYSCTSLAAAAQQVKVAVSEFPAANSGRFILDNSAFSQEFPIRGYEVAPNQHASMVTIANLLQEIAGNHAVGMWGRAEKGFAGMPNVPDIIFVMSRLQIRMESYPKWGDVLRIQTYFTDEGRLAARRDWTIEDARSGKRLGSATSTWVNINMGTRRLTKLPEDLKERFMGFSGPKDRVALPVEETKKKLPDLDGSSDEDSEQVAGPPQIARRSDMDMNDHINNVVYVGWALEAVPEEVFGGYDLHEMEVDFKAECQAGDTVQSALLQLSAPQAAAQSNGSSDGSGRCFLHTLQRRNDGNSTELVRARTSWRKIKA